MRKSIQIILTSMSLYILYRIWLTIALHNNKDTMVMFYLTNEQIEDFETKLAKEYFKKHNVIFKLFQQNQQNVILNSRAKSQSSGNTKPDCPVDESQKELTKLFELWFHMANLLNVSYALTHGSLLGAWRDGWMIPYDSDLDIMINHEEISKLNQMIDKSFNQNDNKVHLTIHHEYQKKIDQRNRYLCTGRMVSSDSWYRDQCSFIEPLGRLVKGSDVHIDLVGYKVVGQSVVFQTEDNKTVFDTSLVLPYSRCSFNGYATFCPRNTEQLLKNIYGENLQPIRMCIDGSWVYNEKNITM